MTAPRIRDLGTLDGELLLFGGVYSNLQALRALLDLGFPAERAIFTGDVVAYGADALACAEVLAAYGCASIRGNCEVQLLNGAADCGCGFEQGSACDLAAKTWFAHAARQIGPRSKEFWGDWPDWLTFSHQGRRYGAVHGGARDVARFIWPSDPVALFEEEFDAIEAVTGPVDGVICGHSGVAFERVIGDRVWINAGVIGTPPHDGRTATRYAVLSEDGVRFHALNYEVSEAVRAMEDAGLDQGYEVALRSGYWPSEDVFPRELRRNW